MEQSERMIHYDNIHYHEDGVEGMDKQIQCRYCVDSWNRNIKFQYKGVTYSIILDNKNERRERICSSYLREIR